LRGYPGAVGQNRIALSPTVWRKLVGIVCVGSFGTGYTFIATFAIKPQGDKLAEYVEGARLLPVDRSGKRISFSP